MRDEALDALLLTLIATGQTERAFTWSKLETECEHDPCLASEKIDYLKALEVDTLIPLSDKRQTLTQKEGTWELESPQTL